MDTFLDVSGIVKRAKQALNFQKDSELASYFRCFTCNIIQLVRQKPD